VIPRYEVPEMTALFSDGGRLQRWLEIEVLAVEAWARLGVVPAADAARVRERAPVVDEAFVRAVEHRTFSGTRASARGQRVLYVTERCVFRLAEGGGLELIEIAPGIDLEKQVLALMDFAPAISPDLKLMDAALFDAAPMKLRERMLALPLPDRLSFDANNNVLFIDFEGQAVDELADIEEIEAAVTRVVEPLGRRVDVVVNYDHFSIRPELVDAYSAMVDRLTERCYHRVTRYAANGFLKARLEHRG